MILASWIIAGTGAGGVLFFIWFLRYRKHHLKITTELRDEFFRAAGELVRDDGTPDVIVERLTWFAQHIDDPRVTRGVLLAALRGDLRRAVERPPASVVQFLKASRDMRPELRRLHGTALAAGMLANTYMNVLVGPLMRRALFYSVRKSMEQAEIVGSSISMGGAIHHNSAAA